MRSRVNAARRLHTPSPATLIRRSIVVHQHGVRHEIAQLRIGADYRHRPARDGPRADAETTDVMASGQAGTGERPDLICSRQARRASRSRSISRGRRRRCAGCRRRYTGLRRNLRRIAIRAFGHSRCPAYDVSALLCARRTLAHVLLVILRRYPHVTAQSRHSPRARASPRGPARAGIACGLGMEPSVSAK